jgi:hypothetical protein
MTLTPAFDMRGRDRLRRMGGIALAAALALLPAGAALAGGQAPASLRAGATCSKPCTKMDCEDRLTVSLRAFDGLLPREVALELDVDGERLTCALPDLASAEPHACSPQIAVTGQEIQPCRPAGCKGTNRFERLITIAGHPKRVRVRVKHGAQVIGERLFVARYVRVRPNGPGCPPVCQQARKIWQYR